MRTFLLGTVFGIVVATVGITGIANVLQHGVTKVQEVAKEASK